MLSIPTGDQSSGRSVVRKSSSTQKHLSGASLGIPVRNAEDSLQFSEIELMGKDAERK